MAKAKSVTAKKEVKASNSFSLEAFLDKNDKWILIAVCALSAFFIYKLYDYKVSAEGDDSAYIQRAVEFLKLHIFPTFQGSFYPLCLAAVIKVFGFSIGKLKMFSCILGVLNSVLFYLAFRKKLSNTVFWPALLVFAFNGPLLQFASLTFSETLFITLILLSVLALNACLDASEKLIQALAFAALAALAIFLLAITRSSAMAVPVAAILVMLLMRRWKETIAFVLTYALLYGAFNYIEFTVYKVDKKTAGSQRELFMLKNSYNPKEGRETTDGFIKRFQENSNSYISRHFYSILGLRSWEINEKTGQAEMPANWLFTLITIGIFTYAAYDAFRKKRPMVLFLVLTAGAISVLTFLVQTMWDNQRLILSLVPVYLVLLFVGIEAVCSIEKIKFMKKGLLIIFGIVVLANGAKLFSMVDANSEQLAAGQSGNELYGFPPEFESYIQMVLWINKNVPENPKERIVCRKPSIAFVYSGGRDYYGIFRSPEQGVSADSLINQLRVNNVHYVLRDGIAGTMTNYLQIIGTTYPEKLKLVHSIATPVQTDLYKVEY